MNSRSDRLRIGASPAFAGTFRCARPWSGREIIAGYRERRAAAAASCYLGGMIASFVFRPHVRRSDGSIVTPDLLVDRVRVVGPDNVEARPVTQLTMEAILQRPAECAAGRPAYALVAASFGTLLAAGAVFDDALPVGRVAWRYADARSGFRGPLACFVDGDGRTAIDRPVRVPSPSEAMERLGDGSALAPGTAAFVHGAAPAAIPARRMEISLERASGESLFHRLDMVDAGPSA